MPLNKSASVVPIAAPQMPNLGMNNKFKQILNEKVNKLLKLISQFLFTRAKANAQYSLRHMPNNPNERIVNKFTVLKIISG